MLPVVRPKNGIVRHARDERREQLARPGSLDGEDAVVVADLLDRDVVAAPDEVLEVGEVGFRGGQQELVGGGAQDDPVLDHEAAVVAPGRVLGIARGAAADVAGKDSGQEPLRVATVDPVLVERRGVEHAGRVADREVFELVRQLVAVRREMTRPMAPQPGLVEGVRALVEGGRPDHGRDDTRAALAGGRPRPVV